MFCKNCGKETSGGISICPSCGCDPIKGSQYCGKCGSSISPEQAFCSKCGNNLSDITQTANSKKTLRTLYVWVAVVIAVIAIIAIIHSCDSTPAKTEITVAQYERNVINSLTHILLLRLMGAYTLKGTHNFSDNRRRCHRPCRAGVRAIHVCTKLNDCLEWYHGSPC